MLRHAPQESTKKTPGRSTLYNNYLYGAELYNLPRTNLVWYTLFILLYNGPTEMR